MIITCWLNSVEDPHYKRRVDADPSQLTMLDTLDGHDAVVLTDCLDAGHDGRAQFVRVWPSNLNPYFARWWHIALWCESHDGFVWCVDAGDVRLLNDPYPSWLDDETLYIGSEPVDGDNARSVGFWWVEAVHPAHSRWIADNADRALLNPGILGGGTRVVAAFARRVLDLHRDGDATDMVAANRVAASWRGPVASGHPLHTPMWSFRTDDPEALWAHK